MYQRELVRHGVARHLCKQSIAESYLRGARLRRNPQPVNRSYGFEIPGDGVAMLSARVGASSIDLPRQLSDTEGSVLTMVSSHHQNTCCWFPMRYNMQNDGSSRDDEWWRVMGK